MRVLLSSVPAFGHLLALLPYAVALDRRGHDVAVVTGPTMAPVLPGHVSLLAAGPDLPELLAIIQDRIPLDGSGVQPASPEGIGMFFGNLRPRLTAETAVAAATAWAPDLVLAEGLDAVGPVAAHRLALPLATVSLGPVCSLAAARRVDAELATVGLVAAEPGLRFDPWPEAMRPPGFEPPGAMTPVGFEVAAPVGGPEGPGAEVVPAGDGPAVLLSLGTLFDRVEVMQALLDALVTQGLRVAAVGGPGFDASELVTDADRVRFHPFRPLAELIEGVDAVVCHGGAGTILGALAFGRPLVVTPQGADHEINAAGVEAAGVGLSLPSGSTAEQAARAAAEVVGRADLHDAARRMAATMRASPTPDAVVDSLERLDR